MNFDWTPEELEIKNSITTLLDEASVAELQAVEGAEVPEIKRSTESWLKRLAQTGYLNLRIGPSNRADTPRLIAGQEELASASGSLFISVETTARLFGGLVSHFGSTAQLGDVLELLEKGQAVGAVAVSEPADPGMGGGFLTVGRSDGTGYIVDGRKSYVTNGPIADYIAVFGQIDGQTAVFIVQPDLPGVIIGPRIRTLGFDGLTVATLDLNHVQVPRNRILGPFEDHSPLESLRIAEDMVLAIASVGLMERTVSATLAYTRSHERAGKAIFAHQEIRFKLAEMLTLSQTSRLLAHRAGWMYSAADPEALTIIHCAKVFTAEASERVASLAMQIMAGQGYCRGNVVERAYREAKFASIAGTTSEFARMAIAQDLLGRHKV